MFESDLAEVVRIDAPRSLPWTEGIFALLR